MLPLPDLRYSNGICWEVLRKTH